MSELLRSCVSFSENENGEATVAGWLRLRFTAGNRSRVEMKKEFGTSL